MHSILTGRVSVSVKFTLAALAALLTGTPNLSCAEIFYLDPQTGQIETLASSDGNFYDSGKITVKAPPKNSQETEECARLRIYSTENTSHPIFFKLSYDQAFEHGRKSFKCNNYSAAIQLFTVAIRKGENVNLDASTLGTYHNWLGDAYFYSGNYRDFYLQNLAAAKLNPQDDDAIKGLGHYFFELRDYAKAKEYFKNSAAMGNVGAKANYDFLLNYY